jgi:hypothetical protein
MKNPWIDYDYKNPNKVHPLDQELFDKVNKRLAKKKEGSAQVLSSKNVALPYFGNPEANLVLLYANPGLDKKNTAKEETPELQEVFDLARKHKLKNAEAFVFLQDAFIGTPGHKWWLNTLDRLLTRFSDQKHLVLRNIFSAEIHPYKSVKYGALTAKEGSFPTSQYTYELVRKAMERGALILIARAQKEWFAAVPGLENYDRLLFLSSAQNPMISPNNVMVKRKNASLDDAKNTAWQLITFEAMRNLPGSRVQVDGVGPLGN